MTRLTNDMVKDIITSLDDTNDMLMSLTGMDTMELACDAIGIMPEMLELSGIRVGVVPMTSGLGVINKFSESVAEIVKKLGMDSFVTRSADVTGIAEALSERPEIIFMADDIQFIAVNTTNGRYSNNSFSTAAGYVSALKGAAGGLYRKDVLVLGAGRVGGIATEIMVSMGAEVAVYDIDQKRALALSNKTGANVVEYLEEALPSYSYVFNASPGAIDGRSIREGAIISSPGIPYSFDEEGIRKAKAIIHDPLDIGTAVMAIQCASFSRLKTQPGSK